MTGSVSGIGVYVATGGIESTQTLGSCATVEYNSGIEIQSLPSFESLQGAQFDASIEGCN